MTARPIIGTAPSGMVVLTIPSGRASWPFAVHDTGPRPLDPPLKADGTPKALPKATAAAADIAWSVYQRATNEADQLRVFESWVREQLTSSYALALKALQHGTPGSRNAASAQVRAAEGFAQRRELPPGLRAAVGEHACKLATALRRYEPARSVLDEGPTAETAAKGGLPDPIETLLARLTSHQRQAAEEIAYVHRSLTAKLEGGVGSYEGAGSRPSIYEQPFEAMSEMAGEVWFGTFLPWWRGWGREPAIPGARPSKYNVLSAAVIEGFEPPAVDHAFRLPDGRAERVVIEGLERYRPAMRGGTAGFS